MKEPQLTPEVLRALETVERATSPTDIGPAYQELLDWRRRNPSPIISRNLLIMLPVMIALVAVFWALPRLQIEVSEFWRGVVFGAMIVSIIDSITDHHRRATSPLSVEARIEAAIDRWRSMVPAMREIPK
ncbi:MAG: hypothetical protein ACREH4_04675 [Vitreimonas sp.]